MPTKCDITDEKQELISDIKKALNQIEDNNIYLYRDANLDKIVNNAEIFLKEKVNVNFADINTKNIRLHFEEDDEDLLRNTIKVSTDFEIYEGDSFLNVSIDDLKAIFTTSELRKILKRLNDIIYLVFAIPEKNNES